ncbi:MAG: peptidase [Salinisphaeraceae bacterium]|nr:peptidase [Salinisphaeraceae bacterium]
MSAMPRVAKISLYLLGSLVGLVLLGMIALGAVYLYFGPQLPEAGAIGQPELNEPLRVYSADGRLLGEFGTERRLPLPYDEIPSRLVDAFLAAEDDRFFEHPGVDYQGILRAAVNLVLTGQRSQGGSTITMQLARNLYLSRERTYRRKIKEIFLALRMESKLSKQEILEIYLNKIYLGSRAYGVGAAAQVYYNKPAAELSLAQMATLAGLPVAPSLYNPRANAERAESRRNYVLGRMLALNLIDEAEYQQALEEDVEAGASKSRDARYEADYVAEMVRQEMVDRFGEAAYTDGYEVTTTINSERQRAANRALRRGLLSYDARHAWRKPEGRVNAATLDDEAALKKALADRPDAGGLVPAAVLSVNDSGIQVYTEQYGSVSVPASEMPWIRQGRTIDDMMKRGDIVRLAYTGDKQSEWALAQIPAVQGALVALNPANGAIEALAGGYDFQLSKYNRAVQARRQPGSNIKPFVYSAALHKGYTPATVINDAPVVFDDPGTRAWRPKNAGGKIFGPTRMREALTHSRNLVSIRLMGMVGIDDAREYMARFGLPKDRMPDDLSLALGSATFSPLQVARGYAVFANGGYLVEPHFIQSIALEGAEPLFKAEPLRACPSDNCDEDDPAVAPQVIEPENAYLMDSMMRDVVRYGTARKALSLNRKDIAGKTGTTNDQRDAWFTGYNFDLVASVWLGFDRMEPLGRRENGPSAALPIWIDFMRSALDGVKQKSLPRPRGLVDVEIDPKTGLLATGRREEAILETFRVDNIPAAPEFDEYDYENSYGDGGVYDYSESGGDARTYEYQDAPAYQGEPTPDANRGMRQREPSGQAPATRQPAQPERRPEPARPQPQPEPQPQPQPRQPDIQDLF